MRWLERHSYEDWMNDMATMERSSPKGWHAKYQPRTTTSGRSNTRAAVRGWVVVLRSDSDTGTAGLRDCRPNAGSGQR